MNNTKLKGYNPQKRSDKTCFNSDPPSFTEGLNEITDNDCASQEEVINELIAPHKKRFKE